MATELVNRARAVPVPGRGTAHNPFSSERVRPGALPMVLPKGVTVARLFAEFLDTGAQGQLVGPHGSGKSTLLHHLAAHAREQGWSVGCLDLEHPVEISTDETGSNLLLVDGADQLPRREWARLRKACTRFGTALLVTTHVGMGLAWTWTTQVTPATLVQFVRHLLDGWPVEPPSPAMLAELLDEHAGNARLVLFALYDWYERVAGKAVS